MNEPSVFDGPGMTMPLDTVHRIEEPGFTTRTATHAEIHNIVGLENARATYEGLLKLRPDERPFVLTRATYAGGQRYGFTWTGDNSATWNHLRLATQMVLNLGVSGISMVGADVGGFGSSPAPALLTRWVELAAFSPLCRDHAAKGTQPHELWANGPEQEVHSPPLHRNSIQASALHLFARRRVLAHRTSHDAPRVPRLPRDLRAQLRRLRTSRHRISSRPQPADRSRRPSPRRLTTTPCPSRKLTSGTTSGLDSKRRLPRKRLRSRQSLPPRTLERKSPTRVPSILRLKPCPSTCAPEASSRLQPLDPEHG